jgi:hypothetical protein
LQASSGTTAPAGDQTSAAQSGAVAENPAASIVNPSAETPSATNSGAAVPWWRWLLWLVAALLLLGGGFYLLGAAGMVDWRQLRERITSATNRYPSSEVDEFDEEAGGPSGSRYPQWPDDRRRNTYVSDSEDLAFADEDEEEELDEWRYQPPTRPERRDTWSGNTHDVQRFSVDDDDEPGVIPTVDSILASHRRPSAGATFGSAATNEADLPWAEEDVEDEDDTTFDEEPVDEDRFANASLAYRERQEREQRQTADHALEQNDDFANDFDNDDFTDDIEGEDFAEEDDGFAEDDQERRPPSSAFSQFTVDATGNVVSKRDNLPIAAPNQRPATAPPPLPKAAETEQGGPTAKAVSTLPTNRRPGHKLIDQHRLQYRLGITDYDESKPIVDPASGKYIGEFGMGTSNKNGVVQPNGDQVAALEVWLFDKSDEKQMGNQTRILLSEFAVDHNLEQALMRERTDNPRPFTPQKGVHFQLESQNLLLDCTVVDVAYIETGSGKGMFQSLNIDMSVHQKH